MGHDSNKGKAFNEGGKLNVDVCSRCNFAMEPAAADDAAALIHVTRMRWGRQGQPVDAFTKWTVYECLNCGTFHVDAKRADGSGQMDAHTFSRPRPA